MKIFTHILILFIIASSAILPKTMVVCERESGISIEFEQGEACSCISEQIDLLEKVCCNDQECHENDLVTSDCHDQNQIKAGNCQDTKFELIDIISPYEKLVKIPTKILISSTFFNNHIFFKSTTLGLCTPIDVGKINNSHLRLLDQAIFFKSTVVFLV